MHSGKVQIFGIFAGLNLFLFLNYFYFKINILGWRKYFIVIRFFCPGKVHWFKSLLESNIRRFFDTDWSFNKKPDVWKQCSEHWTFTKELRIFQPNNIHMNLSFHSQSFLWLELRKRTYYRVFSFLPSFTPKRVTKAKLRSQKLLCEDTTKNDKHIPLPPEIQPIMTKNN